MAKQLKILLLFLAVALPWDALANTGFIPPHQEVAQIQPLEDSNPATAHPENNSNLFRIPQQAEANGLDSLTELSTPDCLSDLRDLISDRIYNQSYPQDHIPFYFFIAENIERGLTVKKLIFPFHSFL